MGWGEVDMAEVGGWDPSGGLVEGIGLGAIVGEFLEVDIDGGGGWSIDADETGPDA